MKRKADPPSPVKPIPAPGRNCWTADAAVEYAGLLVDGRDSYRAFHKAARSHRLRKLTREAILEDAEWLEQLARWGFSLDPGKPLLEETLYENLMPASPLARGLLWLRDRLGRSEGA